MTCTDNQEAIKAIYKDQYLSRPENVHKRDALVLRLLETEYKQREQLQENSNQQKSPT